MKEVKYHLKSPFDNLPICGQVRAKNYWDGRSWFTNHTDYFTTMKQDGITPDDLCRKCFAVDFLKEEYEKADGEL